MDATRHLLVIADDFGIGPETSRGILDLAARGLVTGTVLLVNSPHAAIAVEDWRRAGEPVDLGWHPCLTLDSPLTPTHRVASLVGPGGRFWPLGPFLRRLLTGRIRAADVRIELQAQYERFCELVGEPPRVVNSHQHVALFPPVGSILLELLQQCLRLVYLRRVREPWPWLATVPGARLKRAVLNWFGRRQAGRQASAGYPGADWLAGLADPSTAGDSDYFTHWLARVPGDTVELMCHPGHADLALAGRDCTPAGGMQPSRVEELCRLADPAFEEACAQAGFVLVGPAEWMAQREWGLTHVA